MFCEGGFNEREINLVAKNGGVGMFGGDIDGLGRGRKF